MVTDNNPYVVIDLVSFERMMHYLNIGKQMAEKSYPHLTEDYDRVIKNVRERAESFTGTQNKPRTHKTY